MSLRRRFVLVFVAFSLVLTAGGGWLAWHLTRGVLEGELEDKLLSVAGAAVATGGIPSGLIPAYRPGDEEEPGWQAIQARLQGLRSEVAAAYIVGPGGTALVTTEPADSVPIGTPLRFLEAYGPELERAWSGEEVTTPLFQGEDGSSYKYAFVPLLPAGPAGREGAEPEAILAVSMAADYLAPLQRFRSAVFWGALLAAVVGALLAGFLATTVVRPLERLGSAARRIERGDMETPVRVERADEVGRLSRAMEQMRVGIVRRDEQLRLMVSQVAHEIRNPLEAVELFTSAAADTDDPEERSRLLRRVRREVVQLERIIHDFLVYARPARPDRVPHDIRGPIREATELVGAEARNGSGSLELELPDAPLVARADPDHVKRVLLNLLRNALQAGERARVRVVRSDDRIVVSVSDDGPGVPPELRERIFEPFVTDRAQGAGLGLAIVRRVTEANGGRIELAAEPGPGFGKGAEFRLYFEVCDEEPAAGAAGEEAESRDPGREVRRAEVPEPGPAGVPGGSASGPAEGHGSTEEEAWPKS